MECWQFYILLCDTTGETFSHTCLHTLPNNLRQFMFLLSGRNNKHALYYLFLHIVFHSFVSQPPSLPVRTITINVISSLSRPFLFLLFPHTIQNLANTFQTNTLIISRAVKSKLPRWSQSVSFQMLQFPGSK